MRLPTSRRNATYCMATAAILAPTNTTVNWVQFVFSVQLSNGADNTIQAQTVSQPLVWTYTGA